MSRLHRLAIGTAMVAFVSLAIHVSPAAADSCPPPGGGHFYNVGTTSGYNMYGGHARATEQNYFASDWSSGGFVDQTLWVISGAASNPYWAEIGYGHGWQGQNVKYFYYARNNPSNPYAEFKLSKPLNGVGWWHTYEILISSSSFFTSKIDGATWATTGGFNNFSQRVEFGGETTSSSSTMPGSPATELWYQASYGGAWNSWSNNGANTYCVSNDPYQWQWDIFPTNGIFWK